MAMYKLLVHLMEIVTNKSLCLAAYVQNMSTYMSFLMSTQITKVLHLLNWSVINL